MEWTIFLSAILLRLDACLSPHCRQSWIEKHMLTYADDLLSKWMVQSKADMSNAVKQVGIILDVLEECGMKINLTKSVILLRLSGRQSRSLKKKLISKQGTQIGIFFPRANGSQTFLPIVSTHGYLGIKISYHNFEEQTLQHRLHIGRIAFLRLRPWLTHRHAYPTQLRVQLWQTCVRSACLHGLQAIGLPPDGPLRIHRHFVTDLRRLAHSHSYHTHETTEALLLRLHMPYPIAHLQETWTRQHERLLQRSQGLSPDDFLQKLDLVSHHAHIMQVFSQSNTPHFVDIQLCPYCDYTCTKQSQLTKHLRHHHLVPKQTNTFEPLRDALAGHPQCAHCETKLATRGGLQRHIIKDNCRYFDQSRPWQASLADHPTLRALAAQKNWTALWTDEGLLQPLRQQCSLCGLQYLSRKALMEHLHRDHASAWDLAQPHVASLAAQTASNPCAACGHEGKRAHPCPVIRQLALIQAMVQENLTASQGEEAGQSHLPTS